MFLTIVYFGLCSLAIAICFLVKAELKKFISKNPVISNEKSLSEYKTVVRLCMYLALAQIGVMCTAICIGIALILARGSSATFLVISGFVGIFKLGKSISYFERQAQSLASTTSDLERQYTKITEIWVKKALPKF